MILSDSRTPLRYSRTMYVREQINMWCYDHWLCARHEVESGCLCMSAYVCSFSILLNRISASVTHDAARFVRENQLERCARSLKTKMRYFKLNFVTHQRIHTYIHETNCICWATGLHTHTAKNTSPRTLTENRHRRCRHRNITFRQSSS